MGLYVEGHSIEEVKDIQFVMVNVQRNVWGSKLKCSIDVGNSFNSESQITDSSGQTITFRSQVDVMNYMYSIGWLYKETVLNHNPSTGVRIFQLIFSRSK